MGCGAPHIGVRRHRTIYVDNILLNDSGDDDFLSLKVIFSCTHDAKYGNAALLIEPCW